MAAGAALGFTHGTIGYAANPHRLFALVVFAIGAFGIVLPRGTPGVVARSGGPALFPVCARVMGAAATAVISMVPLPEAVFSMTVTHTTSHPPYAMAGSMMACTVRFVHTSAC